MSPSIEPVPDNQLPEITPLSFENSTLVSLLTFANGQELCMNLQIELNNLLSRSVQQVRDACERNVMEPQIREGIIGASRTSCESVDGKLTRVVVSSFHDFACEYENVAVRKVYVPDEEVDCDYSQYGLTPMIREGELESAERYLIKCDPVEVDEAAAKMELLIDYHLRNESTALGTGIHEKVVDSLCPTVVEGVERTILNTRGFPLQQVYASISADSAIPADDRVILHSQGLGAADPDVVSGCNSARSWVYAEDANGKPVVPLEWDDVEWTWSYSLVCPTFDPDSGALLSPMEVRIWDRLTCGLDTFREVPGRRRLIDQGEPRLVLSANSTCLAVDMEDEALREHAEALFMFRETPVPTQMKRTLRFSCLYDESLRFEESTDPGPVITESDMLPPVTPGKEEDETGGVLVGVTVVSMFILLMVIVLCLRVKERQDLVKSKGEVASKLNPRFSAAEEAQDQQVTTVGGFGHYVAIVKDKKKTSTSGKDVSLPTHVAAKSSDIKLKGVLGDAKAAVKTHKGTYMGSEVAVKEKTCNSADERNVVTNELIAMSKLEHPSLGRFFGAAFDGEGGVTRCLVVMELGQTNLKGVLMGASVHKDYMVMVGLGWGEQIGGALVYLHSQNSTHGNLKASNVIVDKAGNAKLCDFGCPSLRNGASDVGEVAYAPPEATETGAATAEGDMFAFGVLLWEISHVKPFFSKPWDQATAKVEVKDNKYRPKVSGETPKPLASLIKGCWAQAPAKRTSAQIATKSLTAMLNEQSATRKHTTMKMFELGEKVKVWDPVKARWKKGLWVVNANETKDGMVHLRSEETPSSSSTSKKKKKNKEEWVDAMACFVVD